MLTAATYEQLPLFNSRAKLDVLQQLLFQICDEHAATVQAWAIFPNHYHVIAQFNAAPKLAQFMLQFHAVSARALNALDAAKNRTVWFQYWDSHITLQRAYYARLNYVHQNAVHHGVTKIASNWPWCSAGWFERTAAPSFRKTVYAYPTERLRAADTFTVDPPTD